MGIFGSLAGYLRVELTSADISAVLRAINGMGIPVHDLETVDDLTVRFTIYRRNLKQIQTMAQRKGESVAILHHIGIFWTFSGLRQRPVLLIGMALLLILTLLLPTLVLFIEVEGNDTLPRKLILEAAQEAGISFGASRRAVRSESVKNELLGSLPQLQWAGVNTYGCRAVISVRERAAEDQRSESFGCSNIVASADGVITSVTVTGGSGICGVGQAVRKGQLLISGYTDCGGVIMAGRAAGEIFALTRREMTVVTPSESRIRTRAGDIQTNYSLCIGKKRINFYKGSGISDGSCVKMVTQYHLTLPGGYELPVMLVREQYMDFHTQEHQTDDVQSAAWLCETAKTLLRNAGVALSVVDAQESVQMDNSLIVLRGVYNCTEMIGREQSEQTGDFHGKTD